LTSVRAGSDVLEAAWSHTEYWVRRAAWLAVITVAAYDIMVTFPPQFLPAPLYSHVADHKAGDSNPHSPT